MPMLTRMYLDQGPQIGHEEWILQRRVQTADTGRCRRPRGQTGVVTQTEIQSVTQHGTPDKHWHGLVNEEAVVDHP